MPARATCSRSGTSMYLERLARTYWKYLSRVTLGLIRVEYTDTERAVVLLHRPLVLLRFGAPEYEMSDGRGIVRWTIRDGILVAQAQRRLPGDRRQALPGRRARLRAGARRGRGRELLPGAGDLGGALVLQPTRSRASTCSSRTASCARSRGWSSRSPPSAASPRAARSSSRSDIRTRRAARQRRRLDALLVGRDERGRPEPSGGHCPARAPSHCRRRGGHGAA